MANITRFEEIEAWKTARELTHLVYQISGQGVFERDYGLKDQIRRASVSVMSNIAEGFESRTDIQFINYLGMAKASAGEVRAQLYVALDQKYLTQAQFEQAFSLAQSTSRQLMGFIHYLKQNPRKNRIGEAPATYNL
jgi:four helix bundle protein